MAVVEDGRVRELLDESEMVGFSEDVDRHGAISPGKAARAIEVVQRFQRRAACAGAPCLHLLATQAVRSAGNRAAFVAEVEAAVGAPVAVLSAEDEARLAFDGLVLSSARFGCGEGTPDPFLLVDVGGSSTQLVLGRQAELIEVAAIPLGSGKLTTLHVAGDPPTAAELAAVRDAVDRALVDLPADFRAAGTPTCAYAVGGSAKAMRRVANLPRAGQPIEVSRLHGMLETMRRQNAAAMSNAFAIERQRARVLPAGVTILERVLTAFGVSEIRVKPTGIRDGAVLRLARTGELGVRGLPPAPVQAAAGPL